MGCFYVLGVLVVVCNMFNMKILVIFLFWGFVIGYKGNFFDSLVFRLFLVFFDGFRVDYLKSYDFFYFQNFIKEGVLVEYVKNVFIIKIFLNYYSIVTGLYEESYGIVVNFMYDSVIKKYFFEFNDKDSFWWNGAEFIWVINQFQENRLSVVVMWFGIDVFIYNIIVFYFMNYSSFVFFKERLGNVIIWFSSFNLLVIFVAFYWEELDVSGYKYGFEDKENMRRVLKEVDDFIGDIVLKFKVLGLWDSFNVIIISDYGMVQCFKNRLIDLDFCIDRLNYSVIDLIFVVAIFFKISKQLFKISEIDMFFSDGISYQQ